jgi:hypothetical protein
MFSVFWTAYWNFMKKGLLDQLFDFLGSDTDPDQPDPDQHAL